MRNKKTHKRVLCRIFFFIFLFSCSQGFSQEEFSVDLNEREVKKIESLKGISGTLQVEYQALKEKQQLLKSRQSIGREEEIKSEIQQVTGRIDQLQKDFNEIASGVNIDIFLRDTQPEEFSWGQELKALLSPVISELREFTSRPREIQKLKKDIEYIQEKLKVAQRSQENIQELQQGVDSQKISEMLEQLLKEWQEREGTLNNRFGVLQQRLQKRTSERRSVTESVQGVFQVFFKTKGKHLFLALLASIGLWFIFQYIQMFFHSFSKKVQPLADQVSRFQKVFHILYFLLKVAGVVLAFTISLYLFEDWVLLILTVMFLLGLVWSFKEALPKFWAQTMTLLDLGPVREGERILYNGIPWKVKNINFFSTFENPELLGGTIRLPIQDLSDFRSRPCRDLEPWFPTRKDDWIILGGEVYGQVLLQTPEVVQVKVPGGSIFSYPTPEFVQMSAKNLSKGFRILTSFGLDYGLQSQITGKVIDCIRESVTSDLAREGIEGDRVRVQVEFESAASSSLNLAVITDFVGDLAGSYNWLERLVQKICVDACNQQGFTIPFNQLTVHMANTDHKV